MGLTGGGSNVRIINWQPTFALRIHRLIYEYGWSTKWYPVYTEKLQQRWISDDGKEEWRDVEVVSEELPNCPRYG